MDRDIAVLEDLARDAMAELDRGDRALVLVAQWDG